MKVWVRGALQALGVLISIVAVIALGLWTLLILLCSPLREPALLGASPDGRHLARLISVNPGGATSGFFYDLEIEELDGTRTVLVQRSYEIPIFRWVSEGELVVEHANRDTVLSQADPSGVRVVFRKLAGDLYVR